MDRRTFSAQFYYIFPGKVSLFTFLFFFRQNYFLKQKSLCIVFIFLLSKFGALTPHRSYQRRKIIFFLRILIISISVCKSSRVTKNSFGYFPFRERRRGRKRKQNLTNNLENSVFFCFFLYVC